MIHFVLPLEPISQPQQTPIATQVRRFVAGSSWVFVSRPLTTKVFVVGAVKGNSTQMSGGNAKVLGLDVRLGGPTKAVPPPSFHAVGFVGK